MYAFYKQALPEIYFVNMLLIGKHFCAVKWYKLIHINPLYKNRHLPRLTKPTSPSTKLVHSLIEACPWWLWKSIHGSASNNLPHAHKESPSAFKIKKENRGVQLEWGQKYVWKQEGVRYNVFQMWSKPTSFAEKSGAEIAAEALIMTSLLTMPLMILIMSSLFMRNSTLREVVQHSSTHELLLPPLPFSSQEPMPEKLVKGQTVHWNNGETLLVMIKIIQKRTTQIIFESGY